jgi:hypothetical protein
LTRSCLVKRTLDQKSSFATLNFIREFERFLEMPD